MKTWMVKASTIKELSALYKITPKVFKRWIGVFEHEIGKRVGLYYTAAQVLIIVKRLGPPPDVEVIFGQNHLFRG